MLVEGKSVWKEYKDLEFREELFQEVGQAFEGEHDLKAGKGVLLTVAFFHLQKQWILVEKWLNNYDSKNIE